MCVRVRGHAYTVYASVREDWVRSDPQSERVGFIILDRAHTDAKQVQMRGVWGGGERGA